MLLCGKHTLTPPPFPPSLCSTHRCDITVQAAPYASPTNPTDPSYGGLKFSLRVEDPHQRKGYAEEVYDILVPRPPLPAAAAPGAATGGMGVEAVRVITTHT